MTNRILFTFKFFCYYFFNIKYDLLSITISKLFYFKILFLTSIVILSIFYFVIFNLQFVFKNLLILIININVFLFFFCFLLINIIIIIILIVIIIIAIIKFLIKYNKYNNLDFEKKKFVGFFYLKYQFDIFLFDIYIKYSSS